jgi:glycosyltransferase involved in cell wall biosynthesis
MSKRFLFVSINPVEWGGSEELWFSLASKAVDTRLPVMISVFSNQARHPKIEGLQQKGAFIHKRSLPSFVKEQPFTQRAWAEVKTVLKLDRFVFDWFPIWKFNPDTVVISSGEAFDHYLHDNSYLIQYCLNKKVPYFLISQRNWEHDLDVNESFRESRRILTRNCSGFFFVSHRNYLQACRQMAMEIPQARIVQNPLLVNPKNLLSYPKSNIPKLAVVARLEASIKGQDVLLQALASEKLRSKPFLLTFYGVGKDLQHLQNLVVFYGLNRKVHFAGHVSNVREIWENNQILILPSLVEGTPLGLMEAMASGRTAIVSPVGDVSIWLSNLGYVAAGTSLEQITQALENAFEDSSNWESKGIACRERMKNKYNQDELLHLFECISGNRDLLSTGSSPQNYLLKMKV